MEGSGINNARRAISVALVLCGTAALAGTPLPDPPFFSGGFVPPSSFDYGQEVAVGKVLVKYAKNTGKCDIKAVIALQLAYEPQNLPKVPEIQAKWTLCKAKVSDRYAYERDRLLLKGTPACLDQEAIDDMRDQIDAFLTFALAPNVFCDGDAAAPDPVTGLNIPDFKIEAEGEASVARILTKAGAYSFKCYVLALKYAMAFGGTIPPEYMPKVDACFGKAIVTADTDLAKLDQTNKLPACLPLVAAQTLADFTVQFPGLLTDETYCASPSGAFLD